MKQSTLFSSTNKNSTHIYQNPNIYFSDDNTIDSSKSALYYQNFPNETQTFQYKNNFSKEVVEQKLNRQNQTETPQFKIQSTKSFSQNSGSIQTRDNSSLHRKQLENSGTTQNFYTQQQYQTVDQNQRKSNQLKQQHTPQSQLIIAQVQNFNSKRGSNISRNLRQQESQSYQIEMKKVSPEYLEITNTTDTDNCLIDQDEIPDEWELEQKQDNEETLFDIREKKISMNHQNYSLLKNLKNQIDTSSISHVVLNTDFLSSHFDSRQSLNNQNQNNIVFLSQQQTARNEFQLQNQIKVYTPKNMEQISAQFMKPGHANKIQPKVKISKKPQNFGNRNGNQQSASKVSQEFKNKIINQLYETNYDDDFVNCEETRKFSIREGIMHNPYQSTQFQFPKQSARNENQSQLRKIDNSFGFNFSSSKKYKKRQLSKEDSERVYNRLMQYKIKKNQAIEEVLQLKNEQESKHIQDLQVMHKTKKNNSDLKQRFKMLSADADHRTQRLFQAKMKQSEEFENELKTYFKPQLIAKDPRKSHRAMSTDKNSLSPRARHKQIFQSVQNSAQRGERNSDLSKIPQFQTFQVGQSEQLYQHYIPSLNSQQMNQIEKHVRQQNQYQNFNSQSQQDNQEHGMSIFQKLHESQEGFLRQKNYIQDIRKNLIDKQHHYNFVQDYLQ
eukprot:403360674